jgi:hypothetical protein
MVDEWTGGCAPVTVRLGSWGPATKYYIYSVAGYNMIVGDMNHDAVCMGEHRYGLCSQCPACEPNPLLTWNLIYILTEFYFETVFPNSKK